MPARLSLSTVVPSPPVGHRHVFRARYVGGIVSQWVGDPVDSGIFCHQTYQEQHEWRIRQANCTREGYSHGKLGTCYFIMQLRCLLGRSGIYTV